MRGWKLFGWVMTVFAFLGAVLNIASFVVIHSVLADFGQDLMASFGYFGADILSAVQIDTRLIFLTLLGALAAATVKLTVGTAILVKRSRRWR
jgi:hypothetical protein